MLGDAGPDLSYHRDPARWTRHGGSALLRTVAQGQEFVMDCDAGRLARLAAWLDGMMDGP